jgi:hypothetical protein
MTEEQNKKFITEAIGAKKIFGKYWDKEYGKLKELFTDEEIWMILQKCNDDISIFLGEIPTVNKRLEYYILLAIQNGKWLRDNKVGQTNFAPSPYQPNIEGKQKEKRKTFWDFIQEAE